MTIKPSSAAEIRSLTSALASEDEVTRETAVARLAIFGARAVDRVVAAYPAADRNTRRAILRVLEAIARTITLRYDVAEIRSLLHASARNSHHRRCALPGTPAAAAGTTLRM